MKRLLLTLIAAMVFVISGKVFAQPPANVPEPAKTIELYKGEIPGAIGTAPEPQGGNNFWITSVARPTLAYYPADNDKSGAAIIVCPGGGYAGLTYMFEGTMTAQWLSSKGIAAFVLKYRLPNGHHEVTLQDVHRAMDILNEHRTEWGITSIGIQGASAGGHLAATAAIHYDKPEHRPDFQILFYPVITLEVAHTHRGSLTQLLGPDPSPQLVDHYCLEKHVTADTPPAFVMHSSNDDVVPLRNSLQYCQALSDKGVYQSLHVYPVGGHGWAFHEWFPFKYQWTAELAQWLAQLRMTQGK
jgi:acetyl esterase/lipase